MKNQGVKLTYAAAGDYFIPNIALTEAASENIGKYGRMRKKYLQEHRPGLYNRLVLSEKLQAHLLEIEDVARNRMEVLLPKLAEAAGATGELKGADPLGSVWRPRPSESARCRKAVPPPPPWDGGE